ncbi:threonine ammonia-lyase [Pseudothermotoga sp.]|nr:threonine/serine dehydratase [Pseudothermotoga sp.]MDW8139583.1 threonine/serine dehydratase [Pseudothermotoga sp.]
MSVLTAKQIQEAYERIRRFIHRTTILTSGTLNEMTKRQIFMKAENFQKSGSFKIRGAMNFLLSMSDGERRKGVVTGSSGNHGQALALAGKILGVDVKVVVPKDASAAKVAAIEGYGAKLERFGTSSTERLNRAKQISMEEGRVFVPPFDHFWIMAGQGTVGLEVLEQLDEVDAVLVPCGGCGLIAGIATYVKEKQPNVKIYGVEPEKSNSTYLSLKAGHRVELSNIQTIADGLRTASPGELTFPIVQKYVEDVLLVSEKEIAQAVVFLLERCKVLVEPSGAVTVAAVMFEKLPLKHKKIVVILSGGNVDTERLMEIFTMLRN